MTLRGWWRPRRGGGAPLRRRALAGPRVWLALAAVAVLGGCTTGHPPAGRATGPSATAGTATSATPTTAPAPAVPLPPRGLLRPGSYDTDAVQAIRVTLHLPSLGWAVQGVTRIQFTLEVGQPRDLDDIRAVDVVVPDVVPQPPCAPVARQGPVLPPADLVAWLYHDPCFAPLGAPHPVTVAGRRGVEWQARTRAWTLQDSSNGVAVRVAEVGRMQRRAGEAASIEELALGHLQQFDVVRVGGRQVLLIIEAPAAGFAAFHQAAQQVLDSMRIVPR